MNQFQEQFYQMMTRMRGSTSRTASTSTSTPFQEPREWYLDKNGVIVSRPIEDSKAASAAVVTQQSINHNNNKVKVIADFIASH